MGNNKYLLNEWTCSREFSTFRRSYFEVIIKSYWIRLICKALVWGSLYTYQEDLDTSSLGEAPGCRVGTQRLKLSKVSESERQNWDSGQEHTSVVFSSVWELLSKISPSSLHGKLLLFFQECSFYLLGTFSSAPFSIPTPNPQGRISCSFL